eukprot:s1728_g5.t1
MAAGGDGSGGEYEALEAPMMLQWLSGGLGIYMAPMLQANRALHQQMQPRLEQWRPAWLRHQQLLQISRVAQEAAGNPKRYLQDARQIQQLAKAILRGLGADTFGHFNSPTARGADSFVARFRTIVQSAQYAAHHLDEQVPETWRILLAARAVELELQDTFETFEALAPLPPALDLDDV